MVLTNNEHIVCNRDAIIKYYSKVELENGKIVNENIYVCERHKIVFEEMWENQGKNDSLWGIKYDRLFMWWENNLS